MHVVIWNINKYNWLSGFVLNDQHSSSTLGRWKGISYLYLIAVHHARAASGSPSRCQSAVGVLGTFSLFVLYFHISLGFDPRLVYCSSCCLHGSFECTKNYLISCQIIMEYPEFGPHKDHQVQLLTLNKTSTGITFFSTPRITFCFFSASLFFLTFESVLRIGLESIGLDQKKGKNKRCAARAAVNSQFCSSRGSMALRCARDLVCQFLFPSLQAAYSILPFPTCEETKNIPAVEEERVAGECECEHVCVSETPLCAAWGVFGYDSRLGPSEWISPLDSQRTVTFFAQLAVFNEIFLHFPMKQQISTFKRSLSQWWRAGVFSVLKNPERK